MYAYTHQQPDGNRYLTGRGNMPNAQTLDIKLAGVPRWLVAAPFKGGALWVAILETGATQGFIIEGVQVVETTITLGPLPAGSPPILAVAGDEAFLLTNRSDTAARFSHSVPVGDSGQIAFIEIGGDLVLQKDGFETGRLAVDALPDARLLVDDQERFLLLTKPSTRYPYGIAGDELEATEITLLETRPSLKVAERIAIIGQRVVEGISPIWADVNGDGQREIIVTIKRLGKRGPGGGVFRVRKAAGRGPGGGPGQPPAAPDSRGAIRR